MHGACILTEPLLYCVVVLIIGLCVTYAEKLVTCKIIIVTWELGMIITMTFVPFNIYAYHYTYTKGANQTT